MAFQGENNKKQQQQQQRKRNGCVRAKCKIKSILKILLRDNQNNFTGKYYISN